MGGGRSGADGYGAANPGCSHLTHSRGTFSSMVIRPASVSERAFQSENGHKERQQLGQRLLAIN